MLRILVSTGMLAVFNVCRLVRDMPAREALRARLRAARGRAPSLSTARFLRGFEAGLSAAWDRHLRGEAPAPLVVVAEPGVLGQPEVE